MAIKLLRFLAMLQPSLLEFPSLGIHKRYLLEARVIITTYNGHCSAPFSRALVWLVPPSLLGGGADIVMESIALPHCAWELRQVSSQ
jgi:hypothetical protein